MSMRIGFWRSTRLFSEKPADSRLNVSRRTSKSPNLPLRGKSPDTRAVKLNIGVPPFSTMKV